MRRVVAMRAAEVLSLRRRLRAQERLLRFRGFCFSSLDVSGERSASAAGRMRCERRVTPARFAGFAGWNLAEVTLAQEEAQAGVRFSERLNESDDDGFYEQSESGSLGELETQLVSDRPAPPPPPRPRGRARLTLACRRRNAPPP